MLAHLAGAVAAAAAVAAIPASADAAAAVFALRHAKDALLLQDELLGAYGYNCVVAMH